MTAQQTRPKYELRVNPERPALLSLLVASVVSEAATADVLPVRDDRVEGGHAVLEGNGRDLTAADQAVALRLAELAPILLDGEVSSWCDSASQSSRGDVSKFLNQLNVHLRIRTYIAGNHMTIADLACAVAVGPEGDFLWAEGHSQAKKFVHIGRWFRHLMASFRISAVTKEWTLPNQKKTTNSETSADNNSVTKANKQCGQGSQFVALPNAVMNEVCTRFPPEPSGYLHIGHAKAALLNNHYARTYNGTMIVRFDDTNPTKENVEFEESICEDLALLNIKPDRVTHTSGSFEKLQELMTRLISEGKMYCDDTPKEEMRQERGEGIPSKCRDNSVEDNMRRWQEMIKGSEEGQKNCVRAKIDMQSKNKCLRDPVMYRCCVYPPHHRTGTRFRAYPTYDFACPVVDSWEGVTHALRTNEYADRIPQYAWVQEAADIRKNIIYEFSRMNFVNTVLSKRKLQWIVDQGIVNSWEDPRFPTVRGVLRRGLTVDALMDFVLEQGSSKNVNLHEWDKLWTKNKQLLDPVVPRYMAVAADAVLLSIDGVEEAPTVRSRVLHPKNASVGTAPQVYCQTVLIERDDAKTLNPEGEEVTLMRWGNVIIEKIITEEGGDIQRMEGKFNADGDFKKTKKLHWVPCAEVPTIDGVDATPTKFTIREFDHLITKKKIEDNDTIEDLVNAHSQHDTAAIGDPLLKTLKTGDRLQLERRGYFIVDSEGSNPILIMIPDGRTKAMSSVSTKVDAAVTARGGNVEEISKNQAKKEAKKAEKKKKKAAAIQEATPQG